MTSASLAEIIAEEMAASAREVEELQRSDAEALANLTLMVDNYLASPVRPVEGTPYGHQERLLAEEIGEALSGTVCVREAVGGALSIGTPPAITALDACRFMKRLITEEASYQNLLNRTLAAVKESPGRPAPSQRRAWSCTGFWTP